MQPSWGGLLSVFQSRRSTPWSAALVVVAVALALAPAADAASYTWTGGAASSNWNTAANWNPSVSGVPGAGDTATIPSVATVPVAPATSVDRTVGGLVLESNAQLSVSSGATLSVTGGATLGGTPFSIVVQGGGTLATSGAASILGNVSLLGTTVLALGGTTNWASGTIQSSGGTSAAKVVNTGELTMAANTSFFANDADTFRNAGNLNAVGPGTIGVKSFDNDGTVHLTGAATLELTGPNASPDLQSPSASSGTWDVGAGSTLKYQQGSDTWAGVGAGASGPGTITICCGFNNVGFLSLGPGTTLNPGKLRLFDGNLFVGGQVASTATLDVWDGTIFFTGTGSTLSFGSVTAPFSATRRVDSSTAVSGGQLTLPNQPITQTAGTIQACAGARIVFQGTTTLNGGGVSSCGTNDPGSAENTGAMTANGASIALPGGFVNKGTLAIAGTGTETVRDVINSGTLALSGQPVDDGNNGAGIIQTSGTTTISTGAGFAGPFALQGGVLGGSGSVESLNNTGGTVAPGDSPGTLTVTGAYHQGAGGTLAVEMTGAVPGSSPGYDQLVAGSALFDGGTIAVTTGGGFTPTTQQTFDVVRTPSGSPNPNITFATAPATTGTVGSRPWVAALFAGSPSDTVRLSLGALPPAPASLVAPSVSGTPAAGQVLTCEPGTWSGSPTGFTITWLRDGQPIAGATGATYVVSAGDRGSAISCRVVATNPGGDSAPVTSAAAAIPPAAAAAGPPGPGPQAAPAAVAVAITRIATLPPAKGCVSRRRFPIRLRSVKANRIVRAQINLNGTQVRNVTGKALGLPIDLRGLPRGRFSVEIVTTDSTGRRLVGKRTYRTCVAKRR